MLRNLGQPLILYYCIAVDLLNSQVVLKGCERAGFVLLTAARASVTQKVIEENTPSGAIGDPYLHPYIGAGEAVGGVVDVEESTDKIQLQRIVSRCSCEIYFCYFSEELKTDALEESGVPKIEQETAIGGEETGVDCFTLKHNMLEAVSNSDQYEMMVDIVNNLVLFVHPKKKELAERRRKLQFACKMADMNEMREKIVEQQSDLRDIVSVVRSLERQLFYLDTQSDGNIDEQKRREIVEEMEENKAKQLEVSEKLAIYISCYKQRQVEAARATVCNKLEEEDVLAAVARRFEVCFEDCIWKLTECDGQIAIAQIQIRNFLYTRTVRIDSSGEHHFESTRFQIGTIRVTNLLPDTIYRDTLHRDERVQSRQPSIRLMVRDMAPVGGICVKELFEVNIAPMVAQLTYRFFEKIMLFFFPGRNIHKEDNLDSKFSLTRRIAGTLSMRSNKSVQVERKSSNNNSKHVSGKQATYVELTDIDKMRERADNNNFFLYIKIPEVPFVVSYKGSKDKNIEDVDRFSFLFPLCEFHERNWTWLDVALAVKQRCKRVLLQQFMRQKLLRNRLTGGPETVEGISEEDKKRIALGSLQTSTTVKKKGRGCSTIPS
uniref:Apt1 domain-containing protein n=1 Tax=Angiostrongylus cantonensis TaxID=6313 RepID=A0A158PB93_ANGCA